MNDAFSNIVLMLHQQFHPAIIFRQDDPSLHLSHNLKDLSGLIRSGKVQLKSLLLAKPKQTKTAVMIHQIELTKALNIVNSYRKIAISHPDKNLLRKLKAVYGRMMYYLRSLLRFMFSHFRSGINVDGKLPDYQRDLMACRIQRLLSATYKKFERHEISNELVKFCARPLVEFLQPKHPISLKDYRYFMRFHHQLDSLLHKVTLDDSQIIQFLITACYNEERFAALYIDRITVQIAEVENPAQRILHFYYHLKTIRQMGNGQRLSFKHDRPGISDRLCYWIQEEINFLEKEAGIAGAPAGKETTVQGKLKLALSVQELSLAIRLLMDAKIIMNDNFAEVIRLIVQSVSSSKSEHISPESLRIKSYIFDTSVVNRMKDKIISLINLMRKY